MKQLKALKEVFTAHADPAAAVRMAAYQKHVTPFLGISTPQRRQLQKDFWSAQGLPSAGDLEHLVPALYAEPEREYHYAAIELCYELRKQWTGTELPLFERMIRAASWWDSVDAIAIRLVGAFCLRFPDGMEAVKAYIGSGDMWLRRTAIIFQNSYKRQTNEGFLFDAIGPCLGKKEFFIRKAIGWALREYAKTAPEAVCRFVNAHELSPLSRREALKHLG